MDPRQPANGRPRPLGFEAGSVDTPSPRIAKVLDDGQAAVDAAASDYAATLAALPLSVEQRGWPNSFDLIVPWQDMLGGTFKPADKPAKRKPAKKASTRKAVDKTPAKKAAKATTRKPAKKASTRKAAWVPSS
jgi:pyruvate/2-oxoglutarate dehydrogenase complex dihydrolipoamide acyltransferase (E2) component